MRSLAALILVLVTACSRFHGEKLDSIAKKTRAQILRGEAETARQTAERGLRLAVERHDGVAEWEFRLLHAESLLDSSDRKAALNEIAAAVPGGPAYAVARARRRMLEGRAKLGQPETGEILADARRLAESAAAKDLSLQVQLLQASQLRRRGDLPAATRTLTAVEAGARESGLPDLEAAALANLGSNARESQRYDEALQLLERAEPLAPIGTTIHSFTLMGLFSTYAVLGEFDRAIALQRKVIPQLERAGAKLYLSRAVGEAGRTYLLKDETQQAAPLLKRAYDLATELGRTSEAATWAGNLALAYIDTGDWDAAQQINDEARRLKEALKSPTLAYNTLNAATIARGRGDLNQAQELFRQTLRDAGSETAVLWEAHAGLADASRAAGNRAQAEQEFNAALGVVEHTRADLLRTESKLSVFSRLIRFYRQYVDALMEWKEPDHALAVAESSRAQVLAGRAGGEPERRLAPAAFQQAAVRTGTVLLSYWLAPGRSYVWVVTPRGIHPVTLPGSGAIDPLVEAYRGAVEQQLADPLRTPQPAGEQLYQMLVEPVRQWIPPGSRVLISPDGSLHGLNFEMLPQPGGQRYWIEDVTLSMAPSLSLLMSQPKRPLAPPRLLLLGDPDSADPAFPKLPYAAREINSVAGHFPAPQQQVLRGAAATAQAYLAAPPLGFSNIHFTAHATANRESPLDSAVLLTGGKLSARDVMKAKLAARLVTVSSCRGTGLKSYSGEGLVGFAWAFLHAGASNVIAGRWDVDDQSTASLMDAMYAALARGEAPAAALRSAKLAMVHSPNALRKPYYWAPFQLYTVAP